MASLCRITRRISPFHIPLGIVTGMECRVQSLAPQTRCASSAASTRWKTRQGNDPYTREAKLQGLKSRAAFKLLEGFAPGSWSQVALERTGPYNHVLGIDILPAQPPRGVSSVQGNFLSPAVRAIVKESLRETHARMKEADRARRVKKAPPAPKGAAAAASRPEDVSAAEEAETTPSAASDVAAESGVVELADVGGRKEEVVRTMSYIDMEKRETKSVVEDAKLDDRVVDVVISDMMMNTSGISFRDHAGSMDLCTAALTFACETLRPGGNFVCKFYQGAEDKNFERRLNTVFSRVYRVKPDSSRKESKEAYFVAIGRNKNPLS
ncbi:related to mitochondrial rRNA methyltransferase [Cephalotrichum gorgonifer]|uniref:rRNA methyltransferase 2, mitochondrial n=1 Tax=Cephalotrichum gorgonifer TaxID=2041049 RepID=A0AAE8T0E8_9PEZI|nr:related to mitochondrial rRNA methyltransferase [Cephalotrichum gorgonifer]